MPVKPHNGSRQDEEPAAHRLPKVTEPVYSRIDREPRAHLWMDPRCSPLPGSGSPQQILIVPHSKKHTGQPETLIAGLSLRDSNNNTILCDFFSVYLMVLARSSSNSLGTYQHFQ